MRHWYFLMILGLLLIISMLMFSVSTMLYIDKEFYRYNNDIRRSALPFYRHFILPEHHTLLYGLIARTRPSYRDYCELATRHHWPQDWLGYLPPAQPPGHHISHRHIMQSHILSQFGSHIPSCFCSPGLRYLFEYWGLIFLFLDSSCMGTSRY